MRKIYDGYHRQLVAMVYNFYDKKAFGEAVKNEIISNKQLVEEIHKPIIRKYEKKKYIHLSHTIFGAQI